MTPRLRPGPMTLDDLDELDLDEPILPRPRPAPPSCSEIAQAQCLIIPHLPHVLRGLVHESCWACGIHEPVTRAHIQAHAVGGDSDPTNFFLLCDVCHMEQPDGASLIVQLLWLTSHESCGERLHRRAREMQELMTCVARTCGKEHLLQNWFSALLAGECTIAEPLVFGYSNHRAAKTWAYVEAFLQWAEERT